MGICGEGRRDGASHVTARSQPVHGKGQQPVAVETEACRAAAPGGAWAEPQAAAFVSRDSLCLLERDRLLWGSVRAEIQFGWTDVPSVCPFLLAWRNPASSEHVCVRVGVTRASQSQQTLRNLSNISRSGQNLEVDTEIHRKIHQKTTENI